MPKPDVPTGSEFPGLIGEMMDALAHLAATAAGHVPASTTPKNQNTNADAEDVEGDGGGDTTEPEDASALMGCPYWLITPDAAARLIVLRSIQASAANESQAGGHRGRTTQASGENRPSASTGGWQEANQLDPVPGRALATTDHPDSAENKSEETAPRVSLSPTPGVLLPASTLPPTSEQADSGSSRSPGAAAPAHAASQPPNGATVLALKLTPIPQAQPPEQLADLTAKAAAESQPTHSDLTALANTSLHYAAAHLPEETANHVVLPGGPSEPNRFGRQEAAPADVAGPAAAPATGPQGRADFVADPGPRATFAAGMRNPAENQPPARDGESGAGLAGMAETRSEFARHQSAQAERVRPVEEIDEQRGAADDRRGQPALPLKEPVSTAAGSLSPITASVRPQHASDDVRGAAVQDTPSQTARVWRPAGDALAGTGRSPAPLREISLQLGNGNQRVDVRVSDRGGAVHVAVRSPDAGLGQALRHDLPELSARLERSGFHSEALHPSERSALPATTNPTGHEAASDQEKRRQPPEDRQQPQPRRRQTEPGSEQSRDFARLIALLR